VTDMGRLSAGSKARWNSHGPVVFRDLCRTVSSHTASAAKGDSSEEPGTAGAAGEGPGYRDKGHRPPALTPAAA
jgi:hypothetical protein